MAQLGAGGIFTSPQVRLIAEAGPEAVVPLNKAGALGGTTYVTANIYTKADPNEVVAAIEVYERRNGRGWRAA